MSCAISNKQTFIALLPMADYTVKQGDYLAGIARKHGFSDYRSIWNHPQNSRLKQQRQDPNILYPGDVLFIPDRMTGEESAATEKRHRYQLRAPRLKLRLKIKDYDGKPLVGVDCRVHVRDLIHELKTDGAGLVEVPIAPDAQDGLLQFDDPSLPYDINIPLKVGCLDPIDTLSGQKARLNNLGYYWGPLTDEETDDFRYAVEEFQCDTDLVVNGICDEQTRAKLKNEHGC